MAFKKTENSTAILPFFENDTPSALSCKASIKAAGKKREEETEMEIDWKGILKWERFPETTIEFTDAHIADMRKLLEAHPEIKERSRKELTADLKVKKGKTFFDTALREILNEEIPKWEEIKNVPYTERTPKYRNMSRVLLESNPPEVVAEWIGESVEHLRSLMGTPREIEPNISFFERVKDEWE